MIEATRIPLKMKYRTGRAYKNQKSSLRFSAPHKRIDRQEDKQQIVARIAHNKASQERQSHRVLVLENGAARMRWV